MFFCAFNCIFLFSSLFIISNKKSFSRTYFFLSYFYFFSTCFSNFSKTSSGVVEAKSFTTFSRDLLPWIKRKRQCEDNTLNFLTLLETDLSYTHCRHILVGFLQVTCNFPDSFTATFSWPLWSNQRLSLRVHLTINFITLQGFYLHISIFVIIKAGH